MHQSKTKATNILTRVNMVKLLHATPKRCLWAVSRETTKLYCWKTVLRATWNWIKIMKQLQTVQQVYAHFSFTHHFPSKLGQFLLVFLLLFQMRIFTFCWERHKWCKVLWWVCLFVCPLTTRKPQGQSSPNFFMHVACCHGSVLLWWCCDMLCTSVFVDDIFL